MENENRGNKRKYATPESPEDEDDLSAHKTVAGSSIPDGSEAEEADKNGEEEQIHKSRSPRSQNIELTVEAPKPKARAPKQKPKARATKQKPKAKKPKEPKAPKPAPKPEPTAPKPAPKPEPPAPKAPEPESPPAKLRRVRRAWSFDPPTSAEEFYEREEIGRPVANSEVVKAKKEGKDGLKIGSTANPQPHANTQTRKKVRRSPTSLLKCLFKQD